MALNPFSEEQIIARLQFENPWWATGNLDNYYQSFRPRLYFNLFYPLVKNTTVHRASVLMGPRRVGKTVMIYHTIQQLIAEGVSPQKILYASIETPIILPGTKCRRFFADRQAPVLDQRRSESKKNRRRA